MGRLTKRNEAYCQFCEDYGWCNKEEPCFKYRLYEKLQLYEDLEEQGRLIEVIRCDDCCHQQYCKQAQYLGTDGYCSKAELKELEGDEE